MAFAARRRLATSLSDHFSRRLHPSISHLIPPHHGRSESPSSSAAPPSPQSQPARPIPSSLARPSRSRALTSLPLPFALHLAAHRNFSTTSSASAPDIDVAADMLTDAASSVPVSDQVVSAAASVPVPPAPYAGEVAAAAAESFPPVAALQYLLDAVRSFTGLNWWATIALTAVLIRLLTVPMLINREKSIMKLKDMRPEVEAINEEMRNSTDPRSKKVRRQKLRELFTRHGVTPFTPLKGLFIQGSIFMSVFFAINMQDGKEGNPVAKSMKEFFRFFGVILVPFTIGYPKAIFFYWVTSNLFSLVSGVVIRRPAIRLWLDLPPLKSQPTPARMQALSLFGGPKPSPRVNSSIADKEGEQSGVDSPIADKERKQSSSVLIYRIRDLENRAKSRGESQE
ncbi:hypothetical protein PAHAL_9G632000 [Panicum hallii]|uniref:Membrane insertase YidC/Oxa/ALB C-terminal domain-containing protein n=1 Tax=Panicum hallii TaxID=206008 RepID=A0A2T8I6P5_9POAL|nr:mitochondrial inner membrane protein OXA1-like isoform X2 [Panicum hallii]PVH33336.1 hypothetical protein PAHAL_9G632000 [Panicum hallii]